MRSRVKSTRIAAVAVLLAVSFAPLPAAAQAQAQSVHELYQQALRKERTEGDLTGAIGLYAQVAAGADRTLAARALLRMGEAYEKLGERQAVATYQRLVREFTDQAEPVAAARLRLTALAAAAAPAVAPAADRLVVTLVASHPRIGLLGEISPDGRVMASVDWSTGELELHELATAARRRLTSKGDWSRTYEYAETSVWSPDGGRIAYGWYNQEEFYELRAIGADGSGMRTLFRNPEVTYLWPAAWHPSGTHVLAVLEYRDRSSRLALVPADGGEPVYLRSFAWSWPITATFSPDGRWIAYDFTPDRAAPERDIYVIATDGSAEHTVVEHPAHDLALAWAPDGSGILFTSDRRGTRDLLFQPLRNGVPTAEPALVRADVGRIAGLGFDRAGALYYGTTLAMTDVLEAAVNPDAAGAAELAVRTFEGKNSHPDWSPDGRYFGYLSARPNGAVIVVRDERTGVERTVALQPARRVFDLRVAPGGGSVLFTAWQRDVHGIFIGDMATGAVRLFTETEPDERIEARPQMPMHAWSPDGRTAYFTRKGSGAHRLVAHDVATGSERELFRTASNSGESLIFNPTPAPDGTRLAFSVIEGVPIESTALMVMDLADGRVRELVRTQDWVAPYGWTTDGSAIIYKADEQTPDATGSGHEHVVYRIAAAGGTPVRAGLPGNLRRIHPDGARIAMTRSNNLTEIWRMENYLPHARTQR